ncbi:MAG: flippase-like domain-containing protein [Clostridium sp.]|nr:flippase-like domain-containing protein [Clostridium sp.]MDY4544448.1 lysylphosphatidylglycerol synthase transmembrane domain-containing protein [Bacilli bacterium]
MENKVNYKKKLLKIIGVILSLLILWFMGNQFVKNWEDIKPYLSNMKIGWFIISIIMYAIVFLLTGYNWSYLLWKMDSKLGKMDYLDIHMTSALARYIPGGIWNIVGKAYMCTNKGVEKRATTISMILEYVFQIISSSLFLLFFIPILFANNNNSFWIVALAGLLIILTVIFIPNIIKVGIKVIGKVFKDDTSEINLEKKYVYNVLGRYVGVWLLTGIGLIILVIAFSKVEILQGIYLILSYPISWVIGFLSPSPNGMGIREGVLGVLLGNSYNYQLILLITLTSRIWTILGEIVAFVVFKLVYGINKRGKVK